MIEILGMVSTLLLGLYAGSLLTEAVIFVPYWQQMEPDDFFDRHGSLGPALYRYFAPLTSGAVMSAILMACLYKGQNIIWAVTAGLCALAFATFFIYFKAANEKFANRSVSNEALAQELSHWLSWHWARTLMIIVAFGVSIMA